jgi:hypothetical protein
MFLELAVVGFLAGQYVYHRWIEDKPVKKKAPPRELQLPRIDPGASVPLIYGRYRVRAPILVWHETPYLQTSSYRMNMVFVLGIPFADGAGTSRIHNMWAGDQLLLWLDGAPLHTGNGGFEDPISIVGYDASSGEALGIGLIQLLNGGPTQELVDAGGNGVTHTGVAMLANLSAAGIPGYRGYMTVCLYAWTIGATPSVPNYSFEASSYHTGHPNLSLFGTYQDDANPVNVIYDLLTAKFGKLGIDPNQIDLGSFMAAQYTLFMEGHGYSRFIEDAVDADDILQEIQRQIDGVLRENPTTGKLELKLIRNDFDPLQIPHITKDNCEKIVSGAVGGWTNIHNKLRIVYHNRAKDYAEDTESAENQANASDQDIKNPLILQFPGVCYQSLAKAIAVRELAARSRPLMKMRAIVDRSFVRVSHGDAVKVTWSNPDISGLVFRVANVERGTLEDGKIALDLIQDYYYIWRNQTPKPTGFGNDLPVNFNL